MATNKDYDDVFDADVFVRNLVGLPDHIESNIDPRRHAGEMRRIEERITGVEAERQIFICPNCEKGFGLIQNMRKHIKRGVCKKQTHVENRCPKCNKIFSKREYLKRHLVSKHSTNETCGMSTVSVSQCDGCQKTFSSLSNVRKHLKNGSCRQVCCHCSEKIPSRTGIHSHIREHLDSEFLTVPQLKVLRKQLRLLGKKDAVPATVQSVQIPSSSDSSSDLDVSEAANRNETTVPIYDQERTPNFNQTLVRFRIRPVGVEMQDMMKLFSNKRQQFSDNIKNEIKRLRGVKWYLCVNVKMTKYSADGEIKDHASPNFRSTTQRVLKHEEIPSQIDEAYFKVCDSLERFKADGSGWHLDEIVLVEQTVLKYNPLRGSCSTYTIPERLKRKSCLLSVTGAPGNSLECFRWSVLAGLHAPPEMTGEIHFSQLNQYRNTISFDGIEDRGKRMPLSQIPEFEKTNKISINIIGYVNEPFPLYISRNLDRNTNKHVNLLLVSNTEEESGHSESDGHYCLIQCMSRLLHGEKVRRNGRLFYCMRCLNHKYSAESLAEHERICSELQPMNVVTVSEEKKWLEFKNYKRQIECPFVIVADFECYSCKLYDRNEPDQGRTVRERRLDPCAFAYLRISRDDSYPCDPVCYVGKDTDDTMMQFLKCMDEEQKKVFEILSKTVPATLCDIGVRNQMNSNDACWSCSSPFLAGDKICVDHDHVTGTIRGNSCNRCNLQLQEPNFLPIILHNMSKFDGRLIMSAVGKYGHKNISVLPQSVDTYVSIMIGKCRYLDSKRFLNASLASLVENASSESASFKYLSKFIPEEHLPLFLKKQPFCYDYLDGPEKLTETILPPRAAFFDRLSETEISDSDYEHVQRVWNAMGMRTLQDFLETYLLSDVLLLADVLSIFRKNMMDSFRLDPMHYFSLSGFSFDCALRQTETKIELLTCLEMHQMIENAIRGGLATVGSPRYAKANNPLMPEEEYEPENPTSFMHFYDFNGLYTSVMKNYPLPTFGFRWLSEYELERFDVMSIPASSDHGYIVECDLHYPEELHDMQDSFPLAPEHVRIKPEDLSEYTKKMAEECGISLEALREIKKLCLTLRDKKHYVTHYMSLQFYLKHGLVLTKIHRVIRFTQTPWLEDFMTDAADKRRGSKSKLYQTIFKGIPNSVYGKLLESVRSHKDVKICTSAERLHKLVGLPTFATLHEFGENLAAVQLNKERVVLNRPFAVGFCVLELAKLETYKFYYDFVQPAFKDGSVSLLMQDTDSFLIKIDGYDDVDKILKKHSHLFDFSNLPEGHKLKNDDNRMKPGYVKFELGAEICCEFCALSPKCYSLRTDTGFKQTMKGSRKRLSHELYKECLLEDKCHEDKVRDIKNYGQTLYQVSVLRRLLNPIDLKRYYQNTTKSLSFGHYKIR